VLFIITDFEYDRQNIVISKIPLIAMTYLSQHNPGENPRYLSTVKELSLLIF